MEFQTISVFQMRRSRLFESLFDDDRGDFPLLTGLYEHL